MNAGQEILNMAEQNNGIVTAAMVSGAGLPHGSLKYLSDNGFLEKTARGVYVLADAPEDEFVNLQSRYKKGIFSLNTALFLCGLTDRTPIAFNMTFPYSYNMTQPKSEGVICNSISRSLYEIGIADRITPFGNTVRAYNAERTLCDILSPRNHVDIQIIATAFRQYTGQPDRNIPLLSEYAKLFRVDERVRHYLEVLL